MRLDKRYGVARLTTNSGIRLLAYGDAVMVEEGYDNGGTEELAYRYLGANGRLDLANQDYSDSSLWAPVGGEAGAVYRYVGSDGSVDLNSQNYNDPDLWLQLGGQPGTVYQYMGEDDTFDLAAQNYTDLALWKPVTDTQLFPLGFNIDQSPSATIGAIVVLNDVRSATLAHIDNATVSAASVTVTASVQAVIRALADSTASSSGGSGITGQGTSLALNAVITTNRILSKGNAYVAGSDVTATAGDITIAASNLSQVDADTESASRRARTRWGSSSPSTRSAGRRRTSSSRHSTRCIGDPTIQTAVRRPGAGGDARLRQRLDKARESRRQALGGLGRLDFAVVGNSATSAPAALFGAGGMSVSGVLASSMVTRVVRAFVRRWDVSAGRTVPAIHRAR